ncbi:hypothetical protein B7R22_17285 [Subtercola boreus]|uniref:TIGR04255 family protein n=1 Tax=Subtercola boreus TaxID=120213 RepID=A0A3E0VR52_9MICO|nr:hypothetical protein B7R22_17285 [Subtercola boreus]
MQRVRMTFFFKELAALQVTSLSAFIDNLRSAMPDVSEEFPLPMRDDATGVGVFVSSRTALPFPLISFRDPSTGRGIHFQADRFSLTWEFYGEGEEKRYPGFVDLREQFVIAYGKFCTAIGEQMGAIPDVTGAQCLYHNAISEIPGAGLALYLLTGRDDLTAREVIRNRTYAGARVRFPLLGPIESKVSAGVDTPSDDESDLWIKVSSATPESDSSLRDPYDLLDEAHDVLIRHFIQFTPEWLREQWKAQR